MAALVRKQPQRLYQTIGGVGLSEADREQADRLDKRVECKMKQLEEKLAAENLMPRERGKGSLLAYWKLGKALREVTQSDDFPDLAELPLLWQNAKMYIPDPLLYKERGPHREHLWYCYRLAQHSKGLVKRMKWGEWVTIFDSIGINQEQRFDEWFGEKLSLLVEAPERQMIRRFAPCVNSMMGNIELSALTTEELFNCYEAAWEVALFWHSRTDADTPKRTEVQRAIGECLVRLDDVMQGELSPQEFAAEVLGTCSTG